MARSKQLWPENPPSEEDAKWAAALFEEKGGFMPYGSRSAFRLHSSDPDLHKRLLETFGGSVQRVSQTLRYILFGEPLLLFLKHVSPHLSSPASRELAALAQQAVSQEKPSARIPGEDLLRAQLASREARGEAQPSQRLADAAVPPPPWLPTDALFQSIDLEPRSFFASSQSEAEAFALAASSAGLISTQEGLLVRISRGV